MSERSFAPHYALCLLLSSTMLLAACSKKPVPEAPPRAVKLLTVGSSAATAQAETFAGEVHARIETSLSFRVAGKLLSRSAELGQSVRAGQALAQLDPQDYRLGAQAAQAQAQAAQTSRDLAAADLKRYQELRRQGFISGAQLEKLQAQLDAAQAQLDHAQAQAQVQNHQVQSGVLAADHAGIITAVLAEPGQVLAAGQAVVKLAQDGPRDVIFALPEGRQGSLPVGTAVRISSWTANPAQAEHAWTGRVREVAASADAVTRTFTVKVGIDAAQNLAPALGSTVRVMPPQREAQATPTSMTLPLSAIKREGNKTIVWVYEPKTSQVQPRTVQTAAVQGNSISITHGLNAGEQIVSAGVHTLTTGQKVQPYVGKPAVEAASPAAAKPSASAVGA